MGGGAVAINGFEFVFVPSRHIEKNRALPDLVQFQGSHKNNVPGI